MRRSGMVRTGVIAVTLVLCGCEKKPVCPAPPEKAHGISADEAAASEAFNKDGSFCEELVNPKLTLRGDELTVTSVGTRTVMRRADIPVDRPARLAPLADALAAHRDTLRFVRNQPAQRLDFDVDPKLESLRAINVVATANATDWPQMMVKATDGAFIRWWSPALQDSTKGSLRKALYLELLDGQQLIVRRPGGDCATPAVSRTAAAKAISRICDENAKRMKDEPDPKDTGRCVDEIEMRVPASMPFGETAQVAALVIATLAAQKSAAPIALLAKGLDFEPALAPTEEMKRCAKP